MNIWTYDIYQHNMIQKVFGADKNAPKFVFSILCIFWKYAKKKSMYKFLIKNIIHPYYNDLPKFKKILFFSISSNNYRALEPIAKKMDEGDYTFIHFNEYVKYFPDKIVVFYSFIYLFALIRSYHKATIEQRAIMRSHFEDFFMTAGFIKVLEKLLNKENTRLVIMANDHCYNTRAVLRVAQEKGIKTAYVQHCSVTEYFPPLEFDYSFLDGEESLKKYIMCGPIRSDIYLIGNPRFDIIKKYKKRNLDIQNRTVGIAFNALDKESDIYNLCGELNRNGFTNIIVRTHPGSVLENLEQFITLGVQISNPEKETPFEFISQLHVLISGECGIHLDAALMGVPSICYNFAGNKLIDWYGYIRNGLVEFVNDTQTLLKYISQDMIGVKDSQKTDLIRWYNAAQNSPIEGCVGEVIAEAMESILMDNLSLFDKKYFIKSRTIDGIKIKEI